MKMKLDRVLSKYYFIFPADLCRIRRKTAEPSKNSPLTQKQFIFKNFDSTKKEHLRKVDEH